MKNKNQVPVQKLSSIHYLCVAVFKRLRFLSTFQVTYWLKKSRNLD